MHTSLFCAHAALGLSALALLGVASARPAQAGQTAGSYTSATFNAYGGQFSLGWSFTTGGQPLTVSSVGYLNDGAAGAAATHDVQIYQITSGTAAAPGAGTALFAAPISVTTSGPASAYNTFTFASLANSLTLLANTAYEIVATDNGNGYAVNAVHPVWSGITYGTSTYSSGAATPDFNSSVYASNNAGNFGPNFQFGSPVPEASTLVSFGLLVMLGVGGMVFAARKKKTAAR